MTSTRRTILVVDEDLRMIASVVSALESAGYDAISAPSFREGVRALASSTPAMLLVGLHLGEYNGLHLLMRGRAEHPDLRAIMIGPPSLFVAAEAKALGADAYLPRPVDLDALLAAVRGLFDPAAEPGHDDAPPSGRAVQLSA